MPYEICVNFFRSDQCLMKFSKIQKIWENIHVYVRIFYVGPLNFRHERTFFVTWVKRIKKYLVCNENIASQFVLLTRNTNFFFHNETFMGQHRMPGCTCEYFFRIFKHFKICYFIFFLIGPNAPMSQKVISEKLASIIRFKRYEGPLTSSSLWFTSLNYVIIFQIIQVILF